MLSEVKNTRQVKDEGFRRWFTDDALDLIVWYDEHREIRGFQLCYDKFQDERALTWKRDGGLSHQRVDDGEKTEGLSGHPMTPILLPDGEFDKRSIADRFRSASQHVEPHLAEFVYTRILEHSA